MGTYLNGNSEIQGADGLQTLVLMNPGHFQYSGASTPPATGNFVFLNSAAYPINPSHAPPPQTQQFVGIPLGSHQDPSSQSMQAQAHHEIFAPRVQYNLWKPVDPSAAARESPRAQQGLSLSLFSQQHGQAGFGSFGGEREMVPAKIQPLAVSGGSPASGVTNGFSGMQSVLMSSKYLKAAQELLDEVVNVGNNNGVRPDPTKKSPKAAGESSADGSATAEASGKSGAELSTVEKQEIQMKKAKLINMLDEVEQRYRQYHHQMQIVTSSFEQVAGAGSARSYTALALKTISRQFRCLRDAITGQIRGASKSLGEEDCVGGGKIGGSRLKFVDHQLRQQRALQQLGMSQQNAWRPQRGLPERAVSVLRAWLFEHFLHPYPKDSDKHMLAKQTGLTRSQVSNWFINARVRLWKPMVEEMYVEELKDQDQNGTEDKTLSKSDNMNEDSSHDKSSGAGNTTNTNHDVPSLIGGNVQNHSVFTLAGASELQGITQGSPKKPRGMDMVPRDEYSAMAGAPANFIGGFGQYPIGEIRRFDAEQYTPRFSGNGVSLTLGLPHGESLSAHQGFLPDPNMDQLGEADEFGNVMSIDIERRKRFAAQLLPDFVA